MSEGKGHSAEKTQKSSKYTGNCFHGFQEAEAVLHVSYTQHPVSMAAARLIYFRLSKHVAQKI